MNIVDPSGAHAPIWYGGATIEDALDVVPSRAAPAPNVAAVVPLTSPSTVRGTVTSSRDAAGIPGVLATLYRDVAGFPVVTTTVTASDGSYEFPGLALGSYRVGFTDPAGNHTAGFYGHSATLAGAGAVALSSPGVAVADASLDFIPYYLSGKVTSDFHGVSVPVAHVEIWHQDGSGVWTMETAEYTAGDGTWTIATQWNTPARVRVTDSSGMNNDTWYGGATLETATKLVPTRTSPPYAPIVMHLGHPGGIHGLVLDSFSITPLAGAHVTLLLAATDEVLMTTTTDAGGLYEFPNLGCTSYHLYITDANGIYWPQYYDWVDTIGEATWVGVGAPGWVEAFPLLDRKAVPISVTMTQLSFAAGTPTRLRASDTVTLTTTLTDNMTGAPLSDFPYVAVIRHGQGGAWGPCSAPVTAGPGDGEYRITVPVGTAPTTYRLYVQADYLVTTHSGDLLVSAAPPTPVCRFYNKRTGTHFYTADEGEKNNVLSRLSAIYQLDGVGYQVNPANTTNTRPLYRFYNKRTGTHFYTASESEKNMVIANLSATFNFEGVAYNVSRTTTDGFAVYRFYNMRTGTHFYTATTAERDMVIATMSGTFSYEGPAFYVGD